jgi:hypothetical protein
LHLLVWARRVLRLFWLSSTPRLIVKLFPCSLENLQFLLLLSDLLLCLRLLGWVLDCCFHRILLSCLLQLRVLDTGCRTCYWSLRGLFRHPHEALVLSSRCLLICPKRRHGRSWGLWVDPLSRDSPWFCRVLWFFSYNFCCCKADQW